MFETVIHDLEKDRKGDTFSLLLKDFAETGDLLSSKYLTSLIIQGTVGKEEA